jgi:glycosyltransferase involved in cell wall biosynthesis
MKVNVLIVYRDDLDPAALPTAPDYYHYICVPKSAFEQNSYRLFSLLWQKNRIKVFCTIGGPVDEWLSLFGSFPYLARRRWIHYEEMNKFNPTSIPYCLIAGRTSETHPPLISVMTTTFHSGEKLKRPLESLNSQTYNNWEWVVWDDSKDDVTWKQLERLALEDMRIRIYKAPHCGYIGEMKRRSGALCQGDWIVELDHDDRITPDLFQTIVEIGKKYPKAGFIYSDFYNLSEDWESPQLFGDFPAFGYGWYFKEWARGKFHYVYYAQSFNPTTATHIVGVPNHVRAWKRDVYEAIDKHYEDLAVVDDYELILRTFLHDCEWVRIPRPVYAQYNNTGGNNFTYIRNALIQHLTKHTWQVYGNRVQEKFKKLGYAPCEYPSDPNWLRSKPDYPRYEKTYLKEDLSVVLAFPRSTTPAQIRGCLSAVYQQKTPFLLYVVGHPDSPLEKEMQIWAREHPETLSNLRYWAFTNFDGHVHGPKEIWKLSSVHHMLNYALKVGVRTKWVAYLSPGETKWEPDHLESLVSKMGDKRWYLGSSGNKSEFIHETTLLEEKGYWESGDSPKKMIDKWI